MTEKERLALRSALRRHPEGVETSTNVEEDPPLTDALVAEMVRPRGARKKVPVSVRLDPLVLDWLKSKGPGHLTRINDILTNLMEAEQRSSR